MMIATGWAYSADDTDNKSVIGQVNVLVDGQPAEESIRKLVNLKPGDPLSDFQIDLSLKQLLRTGYFSRAEVMVGESPSWLTFNLIRNVTIKRVRISAPGKVKNRINSELPFLRKGSVISENTREKTIREVEKILNEEGLFAPQIDFELKKDSQTNLAEVYLSLPSWKRLRIQNLTYEGKKLIPEERLNRLLGLKSGDYYEPGKVARGLTRIKKAYNQLGYQWAEVRLAREEVEQQPGLVNLVVSLDPSVKIEINITGANLSPKIVQPVWEQKVFEEWALSEGEARLLNHLRKRGYLLATIRPSLSRGEDKIQVRYEVHPGPKLKIEEIEISGAQTFSPKELKKNLGIGEKFLFLPYLDGKEVFALPEKVRLFYEAQGFSQAKVDLNFIRKGNSVKPVIYIEEGPRQIVKSLEIQGSKEISSSEIVGQIDTRPGKPYHKSSLQKDLEKINQLYLNKGFRGTQVAIDVNPDRENNVDLVFRISEGRRVKINNIFISGQHLTSRKIIRREIRLREGDWAAYNRLLETKRGLDSLGVFSEVKLEEIPDAENSVNLSIQVREAEQNYASLGVGIETREEAKSLALWENDLRPRITAEYVRYNIFGNASQFSLVGQLSLAEKRLVATWQQPYIFGLRMRTYFSGYLEKEDRTSFSYERRGLSLSTLRNLPSSFSLLLAAGALRTKLTNLEISESEVERERLPYSIAYGSATFIKDKRDEIFNPQRGYFFSLALERAYPLLNTESNFFKLFLKFQYFYPLASKINFYTTLRIGLASGIVPIPERFFAGGSNSFRGEAFEMLGPKDAESGLPVGGKSIFLFNMEAKFLLLKKLPNLYGAVFYDMGNVFPEIKEFNFLKLSQALGVGLRYKTPLGPVRFDVGWNLNPPQGKWKPLFFLTIGNMF